MALVSLVQSNIVQVLPTRRAARRLLIVAAEDPQPLLRRIAADGRTRLDIARVVEVGQVGERDKLIVQLSPDALKRERIWGIVLISEDPCLLPASILLECRMNGIRVFDQHSFWERQAGCIDIDTLVPTWLCSGDGFRQGWMGVIRKRLLDLFIAFTILIFALPLMLLVALVIKLDSVGPALYRQTRVGVGGRRFTLYKFRSMQLNAEAGGMPKWAEIGDPRTTRVGKFLRYTRIDELPQLFNVLKGEMSIIGPRPERPYFVDKLIAEIPLYSLRHCIRPGITGWAQVNAPYGASIDDTRRKLRYDLYYIKHCNFWLDLKILLRTLRVIVFQEGAR